LSSVNSNTNITIVTPCFNEGETILSFLNNLCDVLQKLPHHFQIVVVDDCSYDNTVEKLKSWKCNCSNAELHLIVLKYNSGHQQAIFQGLLYTKQLQQTHVIIMDADGEDDPKAIVPALQKSDADIVEIKRGKRKESVGFMLSYYFYKLLFKVITGKKMDFGNYCILRYAIVERIQLTSFIHLPAYLLKQKASKSFIVFDRNKRIQGKSKMGYKNLLLHAFKSFIEFGDDMLLWFLRVFAVVFILLIATSVNLLYQKFITQTAILGWFSTLSLGLINLAILCLGFFVMGILMLNLIHNRSKDLREVFTIVIGRKNE
jgi:glycosyltransferase involved in cell wall biosynthesis